MRWRAVFQTDSWVQNEGATSAKFTMPGGWTIEVISALQPADYSFLDFHY